MITQDRRTFLRSSLRASVLATLAPGAPGFLCRTALAAGPRKAGAGDETILVVVQLSGGNDGLNCVVPYADDDYARRRDTLRLTGRDVIRIDDSLGFHPAMTGCRALLDQGVFSIVQGVGYPDSSRDHPAAKRDWQTAQPGEADLQTGWLGRIADLSSEEMNPAAVPVALAAEISMPLALGSERAVIPKLPAQDAGILAAAKRDPEHEHWLGALASAERPAGNPMLEYVRASAATAWERCARIREVAAKNSGARERISGLRIRASAETGRRFDSRRIRIPDFLHRPRR